MLYKNKNKNIHTYNYEMHVTLPRLMAVAAASPPKKKKETKQIWASFAALLIAIAAAVARGLCPNGNSLILSKIHWDRPGDIPSPLLINIIYPPGSAEFPVCLPRPSFCMCWIYFIKIKLTCDKCCEIYHKRYRARASERVCSGEQCQPPPNNEPSIWYLSAFNFTFFLRLLPQSHTRKSKG